MQWANFWQLPQGAVYVGTAEVFGEKVNQWKTPSETNWDEISLSLNNIPIRLRMNTTSGVYDYRYLDFQAGPPPLANFQLPDGQKCPPSKKQLKTKIYQQQSPNFLEMNKQL
jgi:hypothetical protein